MNLTIRTSGGGLRGMVGIIEGATGVTDSGVVIPVEVTVGAGVADAGAVVAIEATIGAGVADAGAVVAIEVTVGAGVADGDHKWNFDAKAMATMNAQITTPKPANNFQSFDGGIGGGATKFRLCRVTPAPALSRSASRICKACSSDSRASGRFPSQSAFVPFW